MKQDNNWSKQELEACVIVYLEMIHKQENEEPLVKRAYFNSLSERFGRTIGAFDYRTRNISYIFAILDREWVKGLNPAKNVGSKVANQLDEILSRLENRPFSELIRKSHDKKRSLSVINKEVSKNSFGEAIDDDIEKY